MSLTLNQAFQNAVNMHREGSFQEAERLYRAILRYQPNHPDANHNLGVLAVTSGKIEQSLPYFRAALDTNSTIEQFWLSYIDALLRLDLLDEASQAFDKGRSFGLQSGSFVQLQQQLGHKKINKLPGDIFKDLEASRQKGDTSKAFKDAQALRYKYPDSVKLHRFFAETSLEMGKIELAQNEFRKLSCLNP